MDNLSGLVKAPVFLLCRSWHLESRARSLEQTQIPLFFFILPNIQDLITPEH